MLEFVWGSFDLVSFGVNSGYESDTSFGPILWDSTILVLEFGLPFFVLVGYFFHSRLKIACLACRLEMATGLPTTVLTWLWTVWNLKKRLTGHHWWILHNILWKRKGGAFWRWHILVVRITISARKHFMGSNCTLHCDMGNISTQKIRTTRIQFPDRKYKSWWSQPSCSTKKCSAYMATYSILATQFACYLLWRLQHAEGIYDWAVFAWQIQ